MSNIDFVLEGLNNVIDLNTLAVLEDGLDISAIEADATATVDIKLTDIKKIFRFIIDSSDIDQNDLDDTLYYVKMNNWPNNLIINPAHAILDASSNTYGTYNDERNMVKHDFVRHLSNEIFGTHKAVDLFTNEDYLKFDIAKKGHEVSWKHIKETLDNAYNSIEQIFYTNESDVSNNFTKELLLQIIHKNPDRLQQISSIMNNQYMSIPFIEGDTINFKTTLYPNPLQKNLTGVENINPRSYNIQLRVQEDVNINVVAPTDAKFVRQTDYNTSYNYTDGFEEFNMPVINSFDISNNTSTTLILIIDANTLNNSSIRINAYDENSNVITSFENIFIDISEETIPAFITLINSGSLNETISEYEQSRGIHQYKFEFVTNDNLEGNAFDTYIYSNNSTGYQRI